MLSDNKYEFICSKSSIWIIESPVVVIVGWLLVASEVVSDYFSQVEIWNERFSNFFSVFQKNVNTIVMFKEISHSVGKWIYFFFQFIDPMI